MLACTGIWTFTSGIGSHGVTWFVTTERGICLQMVCNETSKQRNRLTVTAWKRRRVTAGPEVRDRYLRFP